MMHHPVSALISVGLVSGMLTSERRWSTGRRHECQGK